MNNKKTKNMTKTKTLNKDAMIRNINGLSLGDKAYCGPYGTIKCYKKATPSETVRYIRGTRKFSVSGSCKLPNKGGYTMKALREAISR